MLPTKRADAPPRRGPAARAAESPASFKRRLNRIYIAYTAGLLIFVGVLGVLERLGLPKSWIGFIFLAATVGLYAGIGIMSRTTDPDEYYVAGRRVPAVYNGMATGADWMSAASFLGLAGTLYLSGYGGLAYILGWTGGFCLVALLLAPYLRKFGKYTVPDFIGDRYGGSLPRLIAIVAAILCSFTYVVAQIYGMGLITARLTGVDFVVGIFLGIGAILVCSFLGGMRAVTWTQVAQYILIVIAYGVPVVWLAVKQTGVPLPQAIAGYQLQKVGERERELLADPKVREVVAVFQARADELQRKLQDVPRALAADRLEAQSQLAALKQRHVPLLQIHAAERRLAAVPLDEATARREWSAARSMNEARARPLGGMPPHAQPFAGAPDASAAQRDAFDTSRGNFLALVFVLMVGTAALPHVLMRYYTTPSVRQARESVAWSLFFILLLYLTAPALAVLVKFEVFNVLVGTPFDRLPAWIAQWSRVDGGALLSVADVNHDGLLLTISNALSHDLYYRVIDPKASTAARVTISKALLLVVALAAAAIAAQKPADILFLVSAAFSLAAAAFFPALVLGVFWKRANGWGACLGMLAGLGITVWYMATTQPWLRGVFGVERPVELWFGIQPIAAGVFGVPLGLVVIGLVSWLTPAPDAEAQALVERLRLPEAPGER
jgi:cation/acetate symporter